MMPLAYILPALISAGARITGSWARGEERGDSDFDFYVSPNRWKKFMKLAPRDFESVITGHVAWQTEVGQVEVSKHFERQNKLPFKARELFDRVWLTW